MKKTTSHRLVFTRNHSLNLGDAIPSGLKDDEGARLPFGGRCMVDSILHLPESGRFIVSVSHYPEAPQPQPAKTATTATASGKVKVKV